MRTTTPTASISTFITYMNEQDEAEAEGNHIIGFFGIVTVADDDDDDTTTTTTTRPRGVNVDDDDEVIPFPPPLNVLALSFTNAARARIEKAGGKCLSFHQLPLTFQKQFLFTFPKHHDTMFIFKPNNNNNISSSSNQTTMRNVGRSIQGEYYYRIATMTGLVMDNDDLLCEILVRLSAKTLGQLKVINKRWYSFISHPSFVNKHTSLQTTRGHSTFISQSSERLTTLLSFDCPSPNLLSETTFTLSLLDNYGRPTIVPRPFFNASGRGLLIVQTRYTGFICNPLTKKSKCIPSPYRILFPHYGMIFHGSTSSGQYDYNNHYTLVCLLQGYKAFKFMIFLPKKNRWRDSNKSPRIKFGTNGLKRDSICREIIPVSNRGIIHWLTREGYIIAFDVDKEENRMIEIPKSVTTFEVDRDWCNWTWLGVLEDEVILVVVTSKHEIVTWVLHDYENNKWKIKRKDVINPGGVPIVYIRPLFFDGQRFLLNILTNIPYKIGYYVHLRMEHDVRTGVSKPLLSEGTSCAGSLLCVPITSTLTEV